jgi:hypothetical protein
MGVWDLCSARIFDERTFSYRLLRSILPNFEKLNFFYRISQLPPKKKKIFQEFKKK